ncbi:MAG: C10 family peptidase [Bacteroidales bacterium]|jgi:hypothetical protein|nr:C10 family peptidase [Bacteroidales bacterium]
MRSCLFILAVSIIVSGLLRVQAQSVSFAEAEQIAQHFFGKVHKSMQDNVSVSVQGQDTLLYVFNANDGFVVISGEKKAVPILAYSYESSYDAEHVIPPVKMWMDSYQKQLFALRQDATQQQSISVSKAWKEMQTPSKTHKNTTSPATPLLTSKWGQGKMYNFYCPIDEEGDNKRVVAGCVATAMAQILYYFRYPEKGTGENSYKHELYDTLYADFSQATYNYNAMIDKPKEINLAASLLTSHCGIAVNMNYGVKGSSAHSAAAARALKEHFGYSTETILVHRQGRNDWDSSHIPWDSLYIGWDSLIVDNLNRGIPLYYAGTDTAEYVGHAFVCDAYQKDSNDNYYYHFNFGWEGSQDGYFYTNPLSGTSIAYHVGQDIIINACPDTAKFNYLIPPSLTGNTLLTAEVGSFTDGTISDCPPDMDYTWTVQPDIDDIIEIQFSVQYNLAEGDTLFVSSLNGSLDTVFTDNVLTFSAAVKDTEIIVRLKTTNASTPSRGFSANYVTIYKTYCMGGINSYSSKQGAFGDGSGESRYNNFASCRYRIAVSGDSITIRFSKFETEKDRDILYIHNNIGGNPLLMALSGNYTDSVYTFNTNKLFFIFETNEENIHQGWELSYYTDVPDDSLHTDKLNNDNYFSIYPNPATNYLYVTVNDLLQDGQIQLFDIYGKLLITHTINKEVSQINLNPLAAGMYIVKIVNGKKVYKTKKIIKT